MKQNVTQKCGLLFIDSDSLLIPLLINLSEFNADKKQQSHSIQKHRAGTIFFSEMFKVYSGYLSF